MVNPALGRLRFIEQDLKDAERLLVEAEQVRTVTDHPGSMKRAEAINVLRHALFWASKPLPVSLGVVFDHEGTLYRVIACSASLGVAGCSWYARALEGPESGLRGDGVRKGRDFSTEEIEADLMKVI